MEIPFDLVSIWADRQNIGRFKRYLVRTEYLRGDWLTRKVIDMGFDIKSIAGLHPQYGCIQQTSIKEV